MHGPDIFIVIIFLFVVLMIYIWASRRSLIKDKELTLQEYLWKLKQIIGKSEYEIFQIAAEVKDWPAYQVERHFDGYLKDQRLPVYVKEFLEDGKEHINAYRCRRGKFFNKKVFAFYSLFAMLIIGGSLFVCLYFIPRFYPFDDISQIALEIAIKGNPKATQAIINRAVSYGSKSQKQKACSALKMACNLGYCEYYNMRKRERICQ